MESTEQSRTCTDAARVTTLAPRPKPPVSVFTPDPEQTARWRKLAAVVANSDQPNRGAIDESYDRFRHHADRAFGDEA
ncbi:hypothetical protein [Streptacidiphilus sp. EB129]|uniref:hypothetical protein n=1 Tax=Streptacidiphilus sp. EB129 TaxID=3156262 RepID=UPI0035195FA0